MEKADKSAGDGVEDVTQYGARLDAIEAAWAQFADGFNDLNARMDAVEAQAKLFDGGLQSHENRLGAVEKAASSPVEGVVSEVSGAVVDRLHRLEQHLGLRVARDDKAEG